MASPNETRVVDARCLRKSFRRQDGWGRHLNFDAIRGVDLGLTAGEILAVVGESGCGKSTLLRCLAGLAPLDEGRLSIDGVAGQDLKGKARRSFFRQVQLVFQDPTGALDPRMSIAASLLEAIRSTGKNDEQEQKVEYWLDLVGLPAEHASRFPHQLSGGQNQRVNIARALAAKPRLLLLDEPFSALDPETRIEVIGLLQKVRSHFGIPMVVVGHDLASLRLFADRVAVMYLGRIVELGDTSSTLKNALHPYTRALLAAEPKPIPGHRPDQIVHGEVPIPWAPPAGCAFHPRCAFASERCRAEVPVLEPFGNCSWVACHHPSSTKRPGVSSTDDVTFEPY